MEKINLYINSKNRKTTEKINNININLPNAFLNVKKDEYFILNINSFHTFASWYNCTTSNSSYKLVCKAQNGSIYQILYYNLQVGNPNVNDLKTMLEASISTYIIITYDKVKNKFFYVRNPLFIEDTLTNYKLYICPINCGSFLGIENNIEFEITFAGVYSTNKINVITIKALNIRVDGDINLSDDTVDNFTSSTFQPNNIIFQKVIDIKTNGMLSYKNSDGSNNFSYVLSSNSSGQINNFTLSIVDQDLNLIDDLDDYLIHLQFIKTKKQTTDTILLNILEYIKDLFLMIGNIIYPSKFPTLQEQQVLYINNQRHFETYKNPM